MEEVKFRYAPDGDAYMLVKNRSVPVPNRYAMTIEAAAEYFGIGQKKIRKLAEDNPNAGFFLHNGNRLLIKRKAFEAFLDKLDAV